MGKIIDFFWHKVAMLAMMFYYSIFFTTICLPLMWWHYRIQTTNYYILSVFTLFLGGFVFNIILTKINPIKVEDIREGLPKSFVIKIFVGKFVLYLVSGYAIDVLTENVFLSIYFLMFLMSGGYLWFCILRGYILARNNNKDCELNSSITWQGKVLLFSVPISLLIGYLILL
ncbi:hypothetical protein NC661_02995 [Aquibacillus koreensis]|uniref:Uncharacterized protein n=1 Tax=Aquibacillus koreensis TaxID=279446 RepID=A0A9X3WL76_9BACI|nr:hypothetical protein [Aquibacillus koreensis]MCT2536852.1 hypothetical protein [Aquibacillus koreensis]MDC3419329.1 hypothetical protein [Aquibacillus koreensis]